MTGVEKGEAARQTALKGKEEKRPPQLAQPSRTARCDGPRGEADPYVDRPRAWRDLRRGGCGVQVEREAQGGAGVVGARG